MPKFKEAKKQKPETNSGIYVTAGQIEHSDFDDKDYSEQQKTYTQMLNGEPIISRCSSLLQLPILQAEYRIEHDAENQEAADYLDFVWQNIEGGIQNFKKHALKCVPFGLSMGENLFTRGERWNGKLVNRLYKVNFFQNETINRFYYDEYSRFIGIEHERRVPESGSSLVEIKEGNGIDDIMQRLYWITYNAEYGDIRGKSMLRPLTTSYDCKIKTVLAMVRSAIRGAGFPIIETTGEPSSAEQGLIETIGNTLTAMDNGYLAYNKERMTVRLEELKGQKDNMSLLEFFNRDLFFGMMLEFSTSGIGENGSRASTEAHKAPYELQANYILQVLEKNIEEFNNKVILYNTPWANLKFKPKMKFNSITQIDTLRLSETMRNLYQSMILTKKPEDEKYFREIFGMPIVDMNTSVIQTGKYNSDNYEDEFRYNLKKKTVDSFVSPDFPEDFTDHEVDIGAAAYASCRQKWVSSGGERESPANKKKCSKTAYGAIYQYRKKKGDKRELTQFEKEIFSLESAEEGYLTAQEESEKILKDVFLRALSQVAEYLQKSGKTSFKIKPEYITELNTKLTALYSDLYNRGYKDVHSEIAKLKKETLKLAISPEEKKVSKSIKRFTDKLFFNVTSIIEDRLEKVNLQKVSVQEIVLGFEDAFKTDKRSILQSVEDGYTDGRGQALLENSEQIDEYLYTAILDKSLCDECAPFDNLTFTLEELESEGLSLGLGRVNSNCLGRDKCRCQISPYSLKGV